MNLGYYTALRHRAKPLFALAILSSLPLGCDTSLQPGEQLYALRNPSRTWKIPAKTPVALHKHAALAVDQMQLDFGTVERNVPSIKEVTVSNTGKAPLLLSRQDKTPSLRVAPAGSVQILPGESCALQICWKPVASGATVQQLRFVTNAPQQPRLSLDVSGEVASAVSVDPPMLMADRVRPDRPTETRVLISSELWHQFEIRQVSTDLEGLDWHIESADENQLRVTRAKCGWVLRATLPAGLEPGEIRDHSISLQVVPTGSQSAADEQPRQLEIPIRARVLRRLAVYGGGVDDNGTIHFGVQPRGVPHTRKLTIKVHDAQTKLDLSQIQTQPEFLQVDLRPYRDDVDSAEGNLYRLAVTIPADAPEHIARGPQLGKIQLKFDHPRIEELSLGIDFILHGRATSWNLRDVVN